MAACGGLSHEVSSSAPAIASTVGRAMSTAVCAAEMKFASNCDGASEMPCDSIAWKNRPNLRAIGRGRRRPVGHLMAREEERPHRAHPGKPAALGGRVDGFAHAALEGRAECLEALVEAGSRSMISERRQTCRHRHRMPRHRPCLVHGTGGGDLLHQIEATAEAPTGMPPPITRSADV